MKNNNELIRVSVLPLILNVRMLDIYRKGCSLWLLLFSFSFQKLTFCYFVYFLSVCSFLLYTPSLFIKYFKVSLALCVFMFCFALSVIIRIMQVSLYGTMARAACWETELRSLHISMIQKRYTWDIEFSYTFDLFVFCFSFSGKERINTDKLKRITIR